MTRVLVVEDHLIVQEALISLLRTRADLQVIGAAASIRDTIPLLDHAGVDVLLLDLSLEDGSGLELARTLYKARSRTRVLVMTGFGDAFAAKEAMAAGVAGYLLKTQPSADLFGAIDVIPARWPVRCPHHCRAAALRGPLPPRNQSAGEPFPARERDISSPRLGNQQQGSGPPPVHQREDGRNASHQHRPQARRPYDRQILVRFAAAQGIAIARRAGHEEADHEEADHEEADN